MMRLELLISSSGRLLFSAAAARTFAYGADFRSGNHAFHLELLLMGLSAGSDNGITGQGQLAALEIFLQEGFGILAEGTGVQFPQRGGKKNLDRLPRLLITSVEIYSANHGLQRIRKNRGSLVSSAFQLTFAKSDKLSQLKRLRQFSEYFLVNEVGAYSRQAAFAEIREMMEYQPGDGAVEDGVTKKFKALVVRYAVAAVRQCLPQQCGLVEGVTEF